MLVLPRALPSKDFPRPGEDVAARRQKGELAVAVGDREGSSRKQPSPSRLRRATSPERERLWQGRKVYRLTAGFFLPLTGEDETCPLCQGLSLRESCRRRRLRGFVLEAPLSPQATKRGASCRRRRLRGFVPKATLSVTASPCHLSRKGEALAEAKSLLLNGRLLPAVDR